MADFGNITGGGSRSFGVGRSGTGEGARPWACMAHREINLYIEYSEDKKVLTLLRYAKFATVFCGKLKDRVPGMGWPTWAYDVWKGKFPPVCIKCTGDGGGSSRAREYNNGGDQNGFDNFTVKFGPVKTRRVGTSVIHWQDTELQSLTLLGCCDCCPYEKQYSYPKLDDKHNVPNPNAGKEFNKRNLSEGQMTQLLSDKLQELDSVIRTKKCCV